MQTKTKKTKASTSSTPTQTRIILDLTHLYPSLKKYHDRALESLSEEEQRDLGAKHARFTRLIVKACRAGLADHPLVRGWVSSMRALGDRDTLREARKGLEKGIRRPYKMEEIELSNKINDRLAKGKNYEEIRRALTNERVLPKRISRQAFHKLLTRLGFPTPETRRRVQSRLRVSS